MLKQLGILMIAFFISVVLIVVFNDDVEKDQLFDTTHYTTSNIDTNLNLSIHSEYNENTTYNMSEEQLSNLAANRISIIESSDLIDTIEIYTINLYEDIVEEAVITISGNEITIISDLGPLSTYASISFLPYAQFDYSYFQGIPYRIYEIHIPEGMAYSFD